MNFYQKIKAFFTAKTNKFADTLIGSDPLAMMESEINRATNVINLQKKAIYEFRGAITGLQQRKDQSEENVKKYDYQINQLLLMAHNKQNDAKEEMSEKANELRQEAEIANSAASELSILLKNNQNTFNDLTNKLEKLNKQYDQAVETIKTEHEIILAAQQKSKDLGLQLKISQTTANANKIALEFNQLGSNASLEGIDFYAQKIQDKINANNAISVVDNDLQIGVDVRKVKMLKNIETEEFLNARKKQLGFVENTEHLNLLSNNPI